MKNNKLSSSGLVIFIICIMGVMSQFASDNYTPSLPHIAEYFNASNFIIKTTVGIYFLGMGLSTIFFGYLSDRYGRKKILLSGYVLFSIFYFLFSIFYFLFSIFYFLFSIFYK